MEAEFLDMMLDEFQIAKRLGSGKFAEPIYNIAGETTYRGRVVGRTRMVRNIRGQEVISTAHVFTFGANGIEVTDRITLPDGTRPVILSVATFPDDEGAHHQIVYL